MDNSEDKSQTHPEGENPQANPDSNVRAGYGSGRPQDEAKPAELICRPVRAADNALAANMPAAAPGSMQPVMSGSDIIKSVLRHKLIMLLLFVIIAAPALFLIWTQIVPKYQSAAQIRVRPIIPFLVFKTEESGAIPLYDSYLQTQSSIIKTDTVLQRVLDLPEVKQTQWYINPPVSLVQRLTKTPPSHIDNLKKSLSASPRKGTELIDITFSDASPSDAQRILSLVIEQYMAYVADMSDSTQDKLYNELVTQYNSLDNEIKGREKVTAELRQRLGTSTPEELVSGQRIRLDEAQARLTEVQQNIKILQWEIERITSSDINDVNESSQPVALDEELMKQLLRIEDDQWSKLDLNVKTVQHSIDTTGLTALNPDYIKLQEELKFAEEMLEKRQEQLELQWQFRRKELIEQAKADAEIDDPALDFLKNLPMLQYELGKAQYQEQLVRADLDTQQRVFEELFTSAQSLSNENTTLDHKRQLFDAVRQRLEQKNMERNVPGSIELLAQASVSPRPYQDRRIMLSVMALFFALGLGSAAAFLKDRTDNIIYSLNDLPYPMQATLLGVIPHAVTGKSARGLLKSLYARTKLNVSGMMDSIRIVRTALLSRLDSHDCTAILVTSSADGIDKSNFTMMLSASLSQAGKKVLLIDADFQSRAVSSQCRNIPEEYGFVQALGTGSVYEQHIFRTDMPGLFMVPAGRKGDDIVLDEMANGAFRKFLGEMRKRYDMILIDCAPVLPKADTAILSNQMDGIIIVERQRVSRRTDILNALTRLGSSGGRLLGTVMIGTESN
ncbi:MAG: AAA family ATPase [Sedimentisphaerales bacterium]|nr:AAA family ATPase [Sedimentisphaerales bacterium]